MTPLVLTQTARVTPCMHECKCTCTRHSSSLLTHLCHQVSSHLCTDTSLCTPSSATHSFRQPLWPYPNTHYNVLPEGGNAGQPLVPVHDQHLGCCCHLVKRCFIRKQCSARSRKLNHLLYCAFTAKQARSSLSAGNEQRVQGKGPPAWCCQSNE
jgi:hypothetical protein